MRSLYPHLVRHIAPLTIMSFALGGCGDDGPTGPSPDFELAGTWNWEIRNARSGPVSCNVDNTTITFTGSNTAPAGAFAGHNGGNITCTTSGIGGSPANFGVSDNLKSLSFSGSSISFVFGTAVGDWEMSGSITDDNTMAGTGTIRLTGSGQSLVLTGPWTATRN